MAKQTDKFLPFTNDFIFSLVMQDPLICRELLERILPDEEFSEIKLEVTSSPFSHDDLPSADTQKTLKFSPDSHGVRFDAYIKGQDIWAEVEMQTYTQAFIGKGS